jgi:glycosyltransferase involved in cell wall biosynthesis
MEETEKKKIGIAYHYIAHYRKNIFQRLSKNQQFEFCIFAGLKTDISIKTLPDEFSSIPIEDGGIRWELIDNYWMGNILWQKGLIKQIRQLKCSAVIFLGNVYFLSTWFAAIYCKLNGIKVLMWGHGYLKLEKGIRGYIRKVFYSLAEAHFIYSEHSINIMRKQGLANKRLYKVNNSLDHPLQLRIRKKVAHINSPYAPRFHPTLKLVFIGRLTAQKKIGLVLESLKIILKSDVKASLHIIGDGEILGSLKNLAQTLRVSEFVVFYGACYEEERIASFLYHADVCVSPGEVGLTAMHSMVYGTPVITHGNKCRQMPEFESIISGETGDFFIEGDPEDLAMKILQWNTSHLDREITRRRCYRMIDENYTPKYQERVFISGIRDALNES